MVPRVSMPSVALRATFALAVIATLGGCGTSPRSSSAAHAGGVPGRSLLSANGGCAATVLGTLGNIAVRVYNEGVSSERTATARHLITSSLPLRQAVEAGDAQAVRAAAQSLLASGHMTNLEVMRGGQVLADVGAPHALAPFGGALTAAGSTPIGTYVTSVWAAEGFLAEAKGIAEGSVALRANGHSIAGSFALPRGELPAEGSLTERRISYRYTSFPAAAFPTGQPLRVYLLRSIASTAGLCGHTREDTLVNTLSRVANNIYNGERGARALTQVHRVQDDPALLRAVAAREPAAATQAITALLNQHIVRLRVYAAGRLLSDVGGPYVLAPVSASLRLGGRTIGSLVLSIQDDEGYRRLTHRLAGLDVLMYMGSTLVKNDLGPNPGTVPAGGTYHYRGRTFRVYTLHAEAFPSGLLKINVLIPIPYS